MLFMDTSQALSATSIINTLDLDALSPGGHCFELQLQTNGLGLPRRVPLRVFKAQAAGPKLLISAGVHGDETNGMLTAHGIAQVLSGKLLMGTVVVAPIINQSGALLHRRESYSSDPEAAYHDINRLFPGSAAGCGNQRLVAELWQKLFSLGFDMAIDLHSQTRSCNYPLFVFADYRVPAAQQMAKLMGPDMLLDDPGEKGVLETEMNRIGVPCITVEVGEGKQYQPLLIQRAVEGIRRILAEHNMQEGFDSHVPPCIEGTKLSTHRAEGGGFVIPSVQLLEQVEVGQELAVHYDAWGRELRRYQAKVPGWVVSLNTDPIRDAGALVVKLLCK